MKKNYYIPALILASGIFASCSNELTEDIVPETNIEVSDDFMTRAFPKDDGATELQGMPADKLWRLLQGADSTFATTYSVYELSNFQLSEIQEFTDELVAGRTTEAQKYRAIYDWVRKNVKYAEGQISNEPYDVFINKKAVCQGYANLLNVMLRTQGIHVINSNGYLNSGAFMGHAWNYVKYGGKWRLSDPTNSIEYTASETSKYNQQFLPMSADGNIVENDFIGCNYVNESFNLNVVKMADNAFVVPYSMTLNNGDKVKITSFCPTQDMPENVTEIYIGKNIISLGRDNTIGLRDFGKNIEAAYVDPENKKLSSYCGVVYDNDMSEPLYIPTGMTRMVLKPFETVGKNYVYNHPNIEELHILEGTKKLENWAVEKCPNLKVAYIPLDTELDENAFVDVHPDFQIIRQDQTGIKDVIAD